MISDVQSDTDAFISRWQVASGSERANYQIFLTELCALLALPKPEPAQRDPQHDHYVFERRVVFRHGDGSESQGFIDLYRRGAFVCETKRLKQDSATRGFDDALLRARGQAEGYARALPAEEGRPPFVMVVDVGTVIELYAEFTRSGATYTPFPDPRSHRIPLTALGDPAIRQRLKLVWLDPLALDPARQSAQVTREIATRLAATAKALEAAGHAAQAVAAFLSRCLFTCFAEDVGLIPKRAFLDLLESTKATSGQFVPLVRELWQAMDTGGFSTTIRADLLRFNGKLFKDPYVLPLGRAEIELLIDAARADWRQVEPAIFGTLLESALDPDERRSLGAHYTPRAYVERLVLPTIIEPLRDDWRNAQTAALTLAAEGDLKAAITAVRDFHRRLCSVRVLDPACGSGNFLYVTLEHLKRLEGEVLNQLDALGETRGLLDLAGVSVNPHQCLGIEVNPRAAAIAELVLWIGDLQWHFRTRGHTQPTVPVLKDFNNIECRDAVLANDRMEYVLDQRGVPVTRWDGKTLKPHPVTGEPVPDERARVPLERYVNPRQAGWPEADFVVGNPPFIGAGRMRQALGDGYAEALRKSWPEVPESADFVMYWWGHAAELARAGKLRRFGLVTTNSLRQTFNRRVIERHITAEPPLSLAFAIPDHPWVDTADGAAVRIAMTVGHVGTTPGRLLVVTNEHAGGGEGLDVVLAERSGSIHADMRIGANVAGAKPLRANGLLSSMGIKLHGQGFVLSPADAQRIGWPTVSGIERVVRPYVTSRGLVRAIQPTFVIDLFGLSSVDVRRHYPAVYQWVIERVKPERDHNNRPSYRINWWIFGEPRRELRRALTVFSGTLRQLAPQSTESLFY